MFYCMFYFTCDRCLTGRGGVRVFVGPVVLNDVRSLASKPKTLTLALTLSTLRLKARTCCATCDFHSSVVICNFSTEDSKQLHYRATLVCCAGRGVAMANRPSVCPSVGDVEPFRYCDHIV